MKVINDYKKKDGVTAAEIKSELKAKRLPISVGHCSYIHKDGLFSTHKMLDGEISVNICWPANLKTWDSFEHVLVMDEDFGQPYVPFYDLDEKLNCNPNKSVNKFALNIAGQYNKFMDSLGFLERIKND